MGCDVSGNVRNKSARSEEFGVSFANRNGRRKRTSLPGKSNVAHVSALSSQNVYVRERIINGLHVSINVSHFYDHRFIRPNRRSTLEAKPELRDLSVWQLNTDRSVCYFI